MLLWVGFGRVINAYYDGLFRSVHCDDRGEPFVDFMGVKFRDVFRSMVEVFVDEEWGFLSVNGRTVIDVGAFVGDSAIYFALRGAEKVIAIEPHPGAYQELLENIRLNNMEDKIIPINAGLASRMGWIKISHNVDVNSTASTLYKIDNFGDVMTVTLGEITNKNSIPNNAVLKMDCEGCEYDVILNDYEHVKLFSEVILEYHGDLMPLLNIMKGDYDCSVFDKILYCRRRL
jgi:FkbM family methyltransferase